MKILVKFLEIKIFDNLGIFFTVPILELNLANIEDFIIEWFFHTAWLLFHLKLILFLSFLSWILKFSYLFPCFI